MTTLFVDLSDSEATSIAGGCLPTCTPTTSIEISSSATLSSSSSTEAATSSNVCVTA